MAIICCYERKGGVSKTTTSIHLASAAALTGKKVLLIDLDPQGNSSQVLRSQKLNTPDVSDFIFGNDTFENIAIRRTAETFKDCNTISETESAFQLDILPNNKNVKAPDQYFYTHGYQNDSEAVFFLKNRLRDLKNQYDLIIIDTNPVYNIFNTMALTASDYVLLPVNADGFSQDGLRDCIEDISEVQNNYNPNLEILGILLTRVKSRTLLAKEKFDSYTEKLHDITLKTVIRDDNSIMDAMAHYMPVYFFSKSSAGADYIDACLELGLVSLDQYKTLKKKYFTSSNSFRMHGFLNKE